MDPSSYLSVKNEKKRREKRERKGKIRKKGRKRTTGRILRAIFTDSKIFTFYFNFWSPTKFSNKENEEKRFKCPSISGLPQRGVGERRV